MTLRLCALALSAALAAPPAAAQHHGHAGHGAEHAAPRPADVPTGLSPAEVGGLLAGAGMGLARTADANGYPGPLHVLQLADTLALTGRQRAEAGRLRAEMLAEAVPLGERVVAAERDLDAVFASGGAGWEDVERATARVAALRGRLRAVHLRAHLGMRDALTPEQTALYTRLRRSPHSH